MEPLPTEEAMDSGKRELEQGYTTDVILPTGWRVSLESVLPGHEEWVYSLDWHPSLRKPRDASAQYTDIDPSQGEPFLSHVFHGCVCFMNMLQHRHVKEPPFPTIFQLDAQSSSCCSLRAWIDP